jgi:hypothetical protein
LSDGKNYKIQNIQNEATMRSDVTPIPMTRSSVGGKLHDTEKCIIYVFKMQDLSQIDDKTIEYIFIHPVMKDSIYNFVGKILNYKMKVVVSLSNSCAVLLISQQKTVAVYIKCSQK